MPETGLAPEHHEHDDANEGDTVEGGHVHSGLPAHFHRNGMVVNPYPFVPSTGERWSVDDDLLQARVVDAALAWGVSLNCGGEVELRDRVDLAEAVEALRIHRRTPAGYPPGLDPRAAEVAWDREKTEAEGRRIEQDELFSDLRQSVEAGGEYVVGDWGFQPVADYLIEHPGNPTSSSP